jgi:hypothetical protein
VTGAILLIASIAAAQTGSSGYAGRLALLPIVTEGPHGETTLSSIFADVAEVTSKRLGLRLITYEEMFAVSQEGLGASVLECGPDSSCIASKLRTFNARMGLVVILTFDLDPPVITVQLLDTDEQKLIAETSGEMPPGDPKRLSESIRRRTEEVLEEAGYALASRIVVKVDPPGARVRLAGPSKDIEPDKGTTNVFTLAAGTYRVQAELEGWSPSETQALVGAGETSYVDLELEEESSVAASPWLWVGVGAGVAAIVTGILIGTRRIERCACVTIDGMGCGCE